MHGITNPFVSFDDGTVKCKLKSDGLILRKILAMILVLNRLFLQISNQATKLVLTG